CVRERVCNVTSALSLTHTDTQTHRHTHTHTRYKTTCAHDGGTLQCRQVRRTHTHTQAQTPHHTTPHTHMQARTHTVLTCLWRLLRFLTGRGGGESGGEGLT